MEKQQEIERVKDILSEEFEVDKSLMEDNAPLMKTLDLDSLDIVDMVVLVEKHFGFKMAREDFAGIKTFSDLYGIIIGKTRS